MVTSVTAALFPSTVVTDPAKLFSLFSAAPISANVSSVDGAPPTRVDIWALKYAVVVFSAASDETAAMDADVALMAVCVVAADAASTDATDAMAASRAPFSAEMLVLISA